MKINFLGLGILGMILFSSCAKKEFSFKRADESGLSGGAASNIDGPAGTPEVPQAPSACDQNPGLCRIEKESKTVSKRSDKVDIFIVTDNSGSMQADNAKLGEKIEGLTTILDNKNIDWSMCFTTTLVSNPNRIAGLAQTWSGTNSITLSPTTTNYKAIFKSTMAQVPDQGLDQTGDEQAIHAMAKAVELSANSPCFRSGASLAMIIISDEDEASCGARCRDGGDLPQAQLARSKSSYTNQYQPLNDLNQPESLIARIRTEFPGKAFTAHPLVIKPGDLSCFTAQDATSPAFFGVTYAELATKSGGTLGSICKDGVEFSAQLNGIGQRIISSLDSMVVSCSIQSVVNIIYENTPMGFTKPTAKYNGNRITFSPALSEGIKVTAQFRCLP